MENWGYVDVRDVAAACRLALEAPAEAVGGSPSFIVAAADTVMNRSSSALLAEVFPGVPLTREIAEFGTLLAIDRARQAIGMSPSTPGAITYLGLTAGQPITCAQSRGYHHGDLRAALIDGAVELIAERGAGGFSVAELSRRIGVTVAAPYRHFASRDELLAAVAVRALCAFGQALAAHYVGRRIRRSCGWPRWPAVTSASPRSKARALRGCVRRWPR